MITAQEVWAAIGAFILAMIFAFGIGWHYGGKNVKADWDASIVKEQKKTQELILANEAENAAKLLTMYKTNVKVSDELQAENSRITADLRNAKRMRLTIPAPRTACATPDTASAGRRDETTAGTIALPPVLEGKLYDLAAEADQVSAQLRGCQKWIRDNGFYGQ